MKESTVQALVRLGLELAPLVPDMLLRIREATRGEAVSDVVWNRTVQNLQRADASDFFDERRDPATLYHTWNTHYVSRDDLQKIYRPGDEVYARWVGDGQGGHVEHYVREAGSAVPVPDGELVAVVRQSRRGETEALVIDSETSRLLNL